MTTTDWIEDHFIAGDVALDFANTVYRRWPELGADLFTDAEALATWFARTRLITDEGESGAMIRQTDLEEARGLRTLLWTIFDAQRENHPVPAGAFTGLLDTAGRGVAYVTMHPDGTITSRDTLGAFTVLALRAVRLTLHPPPQGVRACDRCGWFFIDSSRGRQRRWCRMQTCGNQAKAARYRSAHP